MPSFYTYFVTFWNPLEHAILSSQPETTYPMNPFLKALQVSKAKTESKIQSIYLD